MIYQSKKALALLITNIIIFSILYVNHVGKLRVAIADSTALWGKFFLFLLVTIVLSNIVVLLFFNTLNDMVSKNKAPTISDERDRLIELRSVRNFCFVFAFGFFLSMGVLALHYPISLMFTIFAYTFLISDVISYASYIFYYERGY